MTDKIYFNLPLSICQRMFLFASSLKTLIMTAHFFIKLYILLEETDYYVGLIEKTNSLIITKKAHKYYDPLLCYIDLLLY